jgi:hypothetical protein
MRLLLGSNNEPLLLVDVKSDYNPLNFNFYVINGNWDGSFNNGFISIHGCPSGDYSRLDKFEILTDNKDRLRGEYSEVFYNFNNPEYIAPQYINHDFDDDIAF